MRQALAKQTLQKTKKCLRQLKQRYKSTS